LNVALKFNLRRYSLDFTGHTHNFGVGLPGQGGYSEQALDRR